MEKIIKLSVIIPTRNRASLLDRTINSITEQTLSTDDFEVIVVDNGSTDNTKEIAFKYEKALNLNYIYEPKPGLHEGRHAGLKNAKSDILVFIDDDIEAFPEWLETILKIFNKGKNIALVGGKNLPNFESNPPFWIMELWNERNESGQILGDLSILDFGNEEKEISPYYVFGCNFSIRKQVLIDAGGFHPDGMPFDLIRFRGDGESYVSNFILSSNLKAYYHPLASVKHWVSNDRMTEEYFCKRRYTQGISDAFTDLRSNKKENIVKEHSILNKAKNYIHLLLGFPQLNELAEIKKVSHKTDFDKRLAKSYQNGYTYLQNCYSLDDEVKTWVNKKKFL